MSKPAFDWGQYENATPASPNAPAFDWGQYETEQFLTQPTESFLKPYQPPTTPKEQARRTIRSAVNFGLGAYAPLAFGKFGYNLIANELQRHGVNLPTAEEFIENLTGLPIASEQANQIEQLLPIFTGLSTGRSVGAPSPGQPNLPQLPGPKQINVQGKVVPPGGAAQPQPPTPPSPPPSPPPSAGVPPATPPAPPPGGIRPGETLPSTPSLTPMEDQILAALQQAEQRGEAPTLGKMLPFGAPQPERGGQLGGRATAVAERPTAVFAPATSAINIPPVEQPKAELKEKKIFKEEPLIHSITTEKPQSEFDVGTTSYQGIQSNLTEAKKPVNKAYKKSDKVIEYFYYTYPELYKRNEERISRLERIQKRNPQQEQVYQQYLALRSLLPAEGNAEVQASRLIDQAKASAGLTDYEVVYTGVKDLLKAFVKDINESVIDKLKKAKKPYKEVLKANKLYSEMADMFYGDELKDFREKKVENPEALARKMVKDEGVYRAAKKALGAGYDSLMDQVDAAIVENKIGEYYDKKLDEVGDRHYENIVRNLKPLIGDPKTNKVDAYLKKRKAQEQRTITHRGRMKEAEEMKKAEKKIAPERITSATRQRTKPGLERHVRGEKQRPRGFQIREERISHAPKLPEKRVPSPFNKPEEIRKAMRSTSGIRQLKYHLNQIGKPELFDQYRDRTLIEIFKEGKHGEKTLTGDDVTSILDKNKDVLEELLGQPGYSAMYKLGRVAGEEELSKDWLKDVVMAGVKLAANFVGLGKYVKLLPLLFRSK